MAAKKYANKDGMMHESKGQHIGKAPKSLGSAVNNFFDHGNFEAMKTLSGWETARCDEHQFCAKIKVST